MAKIKKTAGPKHEATLSPALLKFVNTSVAVPLYQLPAHLSTFPPRWPFPRGDLYHWIPLLNRFDGILELFIQEYDLKDHVQTRPFGRLLLVKGDEEPGQVYITPSEDDLEALGFGKEGDRELVEAVLVFSRLLLENCGNRSLYSSSGQLNDILNTTSLSLLICTLRLGVRLAQRYHASRQRTVGATSHINSALLLSHYNINLDNVQKLAAPFVKSLPPAEPSQPLSPVTTGKGKEKATSGGTGSLGRVSSVVPVHATDLVALAKGAPAPMSSNTGGEGVDGKKPARSGDAGWEEWGGVWLSYYMNTSTVTGDAKKPAAHGAGIGPAPQVPATATPSRRNTGLGQHQTPRHNRLSSLEDSPGIQPITNVQIPEEMRAGGMKTVEIPYTKLSTSTPFELLKAALPDVPQESHYDLLTRLRVASALTTSLETRREILAVRILAITNLAYVQPEVVFQQKVLQQDSDEPRRLQLAYQLAELVHPPGDRDAGIPRWLQTLALGALEALAKHKTKAPDVCTALSVNVTHGVLLYVVRKAVVEMRVEHNDAESLDEDEWREALFSLLSFLPSTARTGEALVSAGLISILVEVLTIRTSKAERNHPKVLNFLDTFVYNVRDAFQSLANSKGLDAISDLVAFEVDSAFTKALNGEGIPVEYRNHATDYDIPYFQQQTLRALFKFMHHMMGHSGGNFDRLLRNLIDSPQLLGGLRIVLKNGKVFGANVWSGAVNILSSFIHNEPTSYAVIAEAGLSKGFLEAVTCKDIIVPEDKKEPAESTRSEVEHGPSAVVEEAGDDGDGSTSRSHLAADIPEPGQKLITLRDRPLARGILPASDTIACIPQAFGAICLNSAGMKLFQASDALESFFEVFESPEHVKCMDSETDLPGILGSSFDELVRHHPQLKSSVLDSVFAMVVRVGCFVRSRASEKGVGTKLWVEGEDEKIHVSGGWQALAEKQNDMTSMPENPSDAEGEATTTVIEDEGGDIEMNDADAPVAPYHSDRATTPGRAAKYEDVVDMEDEKDGPSVSVYLEVVAKFLGGFFSNTSLCCAFIDMGGVEYILDFCMLRSLPYDFSNRPASQAMARVVHALVEQKPHLVIPSLLRRTQTAVDQLERFVRHEEKFAYFAPLTNRESSGFPKTEETSLRAGEDVKKNGTVYAKSLVVVLNLCHVLAESFSQPMFNHRSTNTIFTQVNLTDMYQRLVEDLGKLHRSCVWEEILLEKTLPELWNEATRLEGFGLGSNEADNIMGLVNIDGETQDNTDANATMGASAIESISVLSIRAESANGAPMVKAEDKTAIIKRDEVTAQFKNVRTLRYLLSQVPSSITNFFQGLARALVAKRAPESYQKQNAFAVADALGSNLLQQLVWRRDMAPSATEQYPYWIVMLTSLSQLLVEGPIERPHHQTLTLVLQAFRKVGGFEVLKEILNRFCAEIQEQSKPAPERDSSEKDGPARLTSAYGGIKIILTLYSQLVSSKNVHESTQTVAISSRERDKDKPDYFHPAQFLVELRMAILPTVQQLWESDFFVDKASNSIVKCLIDIIRMTLEGEGENGAYKRSDKITPRGKVTPREFKPNADLVRSLTSTGFADDLAKEALFRCNNNFQMAQEYCTSRSNHKRVHRYPMPETSSGSSSRPQTVASVSNADTNSQQMVDSAEDGAPTLPLPLVSESHSALLDNPQVEVEEAGSDGSPDRTAIPPPPAPGVPGEEDFPDEGMLAMSIDNLLGNLSNTNIPPQSGLGNGTGNEVGDGGSTAVSGDGGKVMEAGKLPDVVTVDDLEDRRAAIRKQLIDRSLDVLNNPAHSDVTFELADLIKNAVSKSAHADEMRKEVGETLVQSLISLQMEEDFRPQGKKIAAYAHLLGLILQTKQFFDATRDELRENFSVLLGFIKILPSQPPDESSPWIANILLIVEKLLSEAAQPRQIRWTPPGDGERPATPVAEPPDAIIPQPALTELFEAIIEVLPRIGKDESLALSVARTLVILTRHRELAVKLGEKRNLQRLFVMVKQLAGINTDRIQSSIMLILRHVIEDEDTLRNIMRSDIVAWYESRRESRQVDTSSYIRHLYYLILRNPEIFVEVTNEKMKLVRFDPNTRHQHLALKKEEKPKSENAEGVTSEEGETSDKGQEPTTAEKKDEVKVSSEVDGKDAIDKHKGVEVKPPVVENPDGVIHYLLCELLSYKDVDDKEPTPIAKDVTKEASKDGSPAGQTDVEMTNGDAVSSTPSPAPISTLEVKKGEKQEFKADQHPIYIYRCFILQCLTELLSCYNRTKIEFINFSRKALPQPNTPSKPRSGVLNYLLNDLIPVGSLNHSEDMAFRKKYSTSNWAISVIVSLTSKTGERGYKTRDLGEPEEESDLLYVRKFVLEHTLKAYKDASASNEALDAKYSRMLNIADLFNRMLTGRPNSGGGSVSADMLLSSQKQLGKIMFEKNFISAFTNSLADIDLNFPGAKRAVKYILRPLKLLTQTAIDMSESSTISTVPGQTEDETEISTASSSVSDSEDIREETPDLFRNSTLGLFEPSREDETDTDSSDGDEEMYDDEYGDEMDYDEEMPGDNGDVVSDEDEEIEGMEGLPGSVGVDVEVVINPDGDEGTDEDDEDDSDEMDEGEEIEVIDEIDGDEGDENFSGAGDEDEEWQSEDDDEEDYEGNGELDEDIVVHGLHDSPLHHIVRALEGENGLQHAVQQMEHDIDMELDPEGYMEDDMQDDEDLSEEEDEDEDMDDEDLIYEEGPEFEDEDAGLPILPWGWDADGDAPLVTRGHHHHRTPNQWYSLGGPRDPGSLAYRAHRPGLSTRGNDDGTNPLLQRGAAPTPVPGRHGHRRHEAMSDWVHAINAVDGRRGILNSGPVSMLHNLIDVLNSNPALLPHRHAAFHLSIQAGPGGVVPPEVRALLGIRHGIQQEIVRPRDDPAAAVSFVPTVTNVRWQEEARLLYGPGSLHTEKTHRVLNALLSVLVPPAIEEERIRKQKAEEEARKAEEERARQLEEARIAKEKAEREEKEKKEAEERDAAEKAVAEAEAAAARAQEDGETLAEGSGQPAEESSDAQPMEGVETTQNEAPANPDSAAEAGPSEVPAPRAVTMVRGRELDITGMDIDPGFLEALPEDLREEVLMQQIQERRQQAASSGEQPSDISQEFLEALPDDIREEILQQEAQDRRRREREEARRRAQANGEPAQPADIDVPTFLASLDPGLRQAVLLEQDEEVLAQLPQAIAAEANALRGDARLSQFIPRQGRARGLEVDNPRFSDQPSKKPQRKAIVQMLDKAGVATLLRLMFIPQQGSARQTLNGILQNICENRQNRAEVVSLLLSILQDGSADMSAVERSFAHLSLRARQPALQKTPQPLKRTLTGQFPQSNNEMSPLMVVQQCLSSLVFLTQWNRQIPSFFLTEHEAPVGLKRSASRKGKGKESRASKFALNSLLSLLDRKLIMENSSVMEQLSSLLNSITQPLMMLHRKEKDRSDEVSKKEELSEPTPQTENTATQLAEEPGQAVENSSPAIGSNSAATNFESADTAVPDAPIKGDNAEPSASDSKSVEKTSLEDQEAKKVRVPLPPVVPEHNLRLVINILAARECSAKTFRETLSTINNLSAIPEAKEIFGKELVRQAQSLGQSILQALEDLVPQIKSAESGTDVQGMALAKFSPASSDQAKLLRVLTALDYLFDPKKTDSKGRPTDKENEVDGDSSKQKEDLLTSLYENPIFSPLWAKLSECLSAIRQRENMLNVATILLPLIEALMVVCKNTTLKDSPISRAQKEHFAIASPPPESRMESLFFTFTEDHRKILNDLVRQNPKLMSGTFSLLVKNPKVLEFDNKRNYFSRRLHPRGAETRQSVPALQLNVRRDHVFLDSYKSMYYKNGDEMKYGKLSIRFHGEEGVDAGGVTREWFQVLSRQMFNPDYALFTPVASDRTTFHPNRLSGVNTEHLSFFKFIGRIIGKALYEGRVLDCHFSRAVYKRILGKPVSIKDMETLDLDYYKSLVWMLENDITDIITETFSVETDAFGESQTIDLIPNGRNIPVTEENKHEYVRLVVEYRLTGSVQEQLENFLKGFHDIVPAELISIFDEQELELLISGLPDVDVDDWKNNTEYHNYSASSPQIQWFWRAVRSFDKEERAKLLQFVTGTSKVPLNGFKELEGMNGFSRFNIHRDYGNKDRLPSSHTCFNQLDLPEYESYETLRQRLYTAITAGSEYFGFA